MNYSTIKTAVACSLVAALGFAETAQAQEPTVFGGRSQYRTWTIGVNGGFTTPSVLIGGSNSFGKELGLFEYKLREYYGISLRKQFSNWFGLEGNVNRGRIFAHNEGGAKTWYNTSWPGVDPAGYESAETSVQYSASINGVFQFATIDFLRRENAVNFYASVGLGLLAYNPVGYTDAEGSTGAWDNGGNWGQERSDGAELTGDKDYKKATNIPVGVGVKFKLSDRVALNLGYTMNFVDDKTLYGPVLDRATNDKFSYTYAGLEFSLGSSSKPDLTWHNPVSTLYDELKDPSLRNELEALKQRVSTLEGLVDELSRDEDGDGVSDKFDKCPGTPAGTQVDGAGCPIKFPEPVVKETVSATYSNIQFEFDSSVLKTESYATLDRLSSELRESGATVTLDGHASAEGSEAYNLNLSRDRANSVKQYLVNSGVDAAKVNVQAFGESAPIASNATEEGRVLNRRVEIKK
ncbi:OmpA family protein [Parapedobacter koreensis]|uniref:OmpA-OmpF porin, OOP family n=1 Tax=Parapedobacter koreensis TaxID=332977 RepID=A0A1H7T362_9SPHI|nr:OmpA family protein [Parapedobacter koreensis]SEL79340.1 OmpA-OmpF porin, OOP family [Parapedobacter koreensis]